MFFAANSLEVLLHQRYYDWWDWAPRNAERHRAVSVYDLFLQPLKDVLAFFAHIGIRNIVSLEIVFVYFRKSYGWCGIDQQRRDEFLACYSPRSPRVKSPSPGR